MCGIAGFVGSGQAVDLEAMVAAMVHRGPDAKGLWWDEGRRVYLGHRRLAILDLAGGAQPMWTADKRLGVIFNGEIYNHIELRAILQKRGHCFQTDHSDTEVLLHGYQEWGTTLPGRLNGMWAFAIYDVEAGQLFFSRDRFGKKPLYYSRQGSVFAFASELHALTRHPYIHKTVTNLSIQKYLAYGYIPEPNTIFQHIFKLPGGHNLILDMANLEVKTSCYWDFILEPEENGSSQAEDEYAEEIRRLLSLAVKRRLMSDVPLGVLLSGGIDSSAVTFFASQHSSRRVKSFSIGFQEDSFDESIYAQQVARLFKTEHHADLLTMEKARYLIPTVLAKLDEPMADSSLVPTYLLFEHVRRHVTVALGGDGGDELFAGYDVFRALRWAEVYHRIVPKSLHHPIRMVSGLLPVSHRNMSLDFKIKRSLRGLTWPKCLWNSVWLGPLAPDQIIMALNERLDIEAVYEEAIREWNNCSQENLVDKTLQFYTKLYLQADILCKIDRASMMHSVECRSPFLDIDLVDFVRRIPNHLKLRRGQTKCLLKKALAPILPHDIIHRPKKGFGLPIGQWLAEGLIKVGPPLSDIRLNWEYVQACLIEHMLKKEDHRGFLWSYHVLAAYFQSQGCCN